MTAPDFKLKKMNTNDVIHLRSYQGKPMLLTFWASWCPDSQVDLLHKQRFYDHLDKNQLHFLTINVTGRERAAEAAQQLIEREGYTFPVLLDEGTAIYDRYQCMGVPTTFILDAKQEIVNRFNDNAKFIDIMKGLHRVMDSHESEPG
ncbi:Peroxiredoxin [Alteribacillus persepolensis]|uniref:Peroxiredoxin n=1 Tax=Alteribacillus persepolensis TaxID=568899 RepID=A0A1G7ZCU7_9BACI|nr:TlpA disulfide reductase family protein [Alteribacillus persepolensis]SDH05900.1 Peroxiredoxin [Alteribacillus persepolensis]